MISAHAKRGDWRAATALLDAMPTRTVVSFNAAISACSRAARWLERMEKDGPAPDVVSYSSAAAACPQEGRNAPRLKDAKRSVLDTMGTLCGLSLNF